MKKTTLAIGIVAVLGIGYVGTAWYTGNVIESNIDNNLKELTKQVNQNQKMFNVEIAYNNYEKNIFSTNLHLTITLSPKDSSLQDAEPKKIFDDNLTIHHGPFPIAAIMNGTFAPQMAWFNYQMTEQISPELWKLAGNQPFITGSVGVNYQQSLTVQISNKAIKLSNSDFDFIEGELNISDGDHYFKSNKDFTDISINNNFNNLTYVINDNNYLSINKINVSSEPSMDEPVVDYNITFGNLVLSLDELYSNAKFNIDNLKSKGKFNYKNQDTDVTSSIGEFRFEPNSNQLNEIPTIVFKNLTSKEHSNLNETNSSFSGALFTSIESMNFGRQNIGSISLDVDYQNINKKFLTSGLLGFYGYDNQNTNDKKNNMRISLNKFNWHNAEGDINISALLDLTLDNNDDLSSSQDFDKINNLKLNVDVPFRFLARTSAQLENTKDSDVSAKDIDKAEKTIQMMSRMFLSTSPLFTFNKGDTKGIYSDIDYAKDREEVQLNGKTLKKEDFLNQVLED